MKTLKYLKTVLSVSLFAGMMIYGSASAQEYDDMYFNKNDRKTVKVKKSDLNVQNEAVKENYKEFTSSTENVSSKNINPEYIARYKNIDPEQNKDSTSSEYKNDDYFVENYDIKPGSGMVSAKEYLNSKKYNREYTSQTKTNSSFGGFHPSFSMGMGFGYSPFGYGFYPGMGYGMSYSLSMSWGMGGGFYDPWMDPFMFYPTMSFYDQYMMSRFYRPWRYPFYGGYPGGFYPYGGFSTSIGMGFGMGLGFGGYYGGGYGGYGYPYYPYYPGTGGEYSNIKYQQRTPGRSTTSKVHIPREKATVRTADNTRNLRIPGTATVSNNAGNARIAKDYSRTQNEYYNNSRTRNASSRQRISSSAGSRYNYRASSATRSGRTRGTGTTSYSSINNNRPVKGSTGYSNSNSRYLDSGSRSSYRGRSGSTYAPSRSYTPSSFGSGSRSSYSGGSSFSGGSTGGSRSTSGSRSRH